MVILNAGADLGVFERELSQGIKSIRSLAVGFSGETVMGCPRYSPPQKLKQNLNKGAGFGSNWVEAVQTYRAVKLLGKGSAADVASSNPLPM